MSLTTIVEDKKDDQLTRIIDSACSRHMTYSLDVLEDYHPLQVPITINIANKASVQATGEGSTRLKVAIDGPIHTVRLRQVPHAPNLAGSLICVLQLQDRENLMRTTKKGKLMLGLNEKAIGKAIGSEKGRL